MHEGSSVSPMEAAPTVRGVFEADPNHPPPAPCGASAIEIKDHDGRVVFYGWLHPEYDASHMDLTAWQWLDRNVPMHPVTPTVFRPRLLR